MRNKENNKQNVISKRPKYANIMNDDRFMSVMRHLITRRFLNSYNLYVACKYQQSSA